MSYLIQPDLSTPPTSHFVNPYTFPLDAFQQHAFAAISNDENVLVCAKTGSGKTLVGEYQIHHSLKKGKRIFYTTPIKSLSNQKFHDLKHLFPEATVGIMTGDMKFCPDAQIVIMTTEILRNLLYKKGTTTEHLGLTASLSLEELDAVIFDECHYINDKDRGTIWEETMILLPSEINMVMLSATLDHPEYLASWLGALKKKPIHLIETHYRIVPLTHYLLDEDYKLVTLMEPKSGNDVYHEGVYKNWFKEKQGLKDAEYAFQQKVSDVKKGGEMKGGVEGKVHRSHFVHQLNETVAMLEKKELLPALFFVLSRKQCESYADKVEHTLLSPADIASVKHLIGFHLHRHMDVLEKVPQYHQIYSLLCKGVAFHHSGLLPLLKEIVEILFSKGLVKIMFCTETFAVGLNMPTKTVLFAGFKKYDDLTASMRILRNDEYLQMAGRAGRRGKDDKGVVIYLPDREPVWPIEMQAMMKGAKPPIQSRMDFHYDFFLKTIQASDEPLKWLQIMEQSYWFRQQQDEINRLQKERDQIKVSIQDMNLVEPFLSECKKRQELEQVIKTTVNAARKDAQRQLDSLKNKQVGPKWTKAWTDYQSLHGLEKKIENLEYDIACLEEHESSIDPVIQFLYEMGYIKHNDSHTLTNKDLTLKGILATEVNEGHAILMTELYTKELCHALSGVELVCVLACFQEKKDTEDNPALYDIHVSSDVKNVILSLEQMIIQFKTLESKVGYPIRNYWTTSTKMIEPMKRWLEGEHASVICSDHDLFEGNFIRSVMKIANMLDEWLAMATYCQHTDQIEKMMEVRSYLVRDVVVSDSLYLRL